MRLLQCLPDDVNASFIWDRSCYGHDSLHHWIFRLCLRPELRPVPTLSLCGRRGIHRGGGDIFLTLSPFHVAITRDGVGHREATQHYDIVRSRVIHHDGLEHHIDTQALHDGHQKSTTMGNATGSCSMTLASVTDSA